MPLTSNERRKKWRATHRDNDHEIQRRYYEKNKDKSYARVVRFRLFKSECKRLMNILLD